MVKMPKFKIDSSYKRRGGTAQWLVIRCKLCNNLLCLYQKDGSGNLYRLYADRISDMEGNRTLQTLDIHYNGGLLCPSCKAVFAVSMIYKKDTNPRLAFRIINPGITKAVIKSEKSFTSSPLCQLDLLSMLTS